MIAYYLQRGHSLDELLNLSYTAKIFYQQAMTATMEMIGGE